MVTRLQNFITDYAPLKVFIFVNAILNRPSPFIRQHFTRQWFQVSLFANILPPQKFCMVLCLAFQCRKQSTE